MIDLNIRATTIKLLEKHIKKNELELGKEFLDMESKAKSTK